MNIKKKRFLTIAIVLTAFCILTMFTAYRLAFAKTNETELLEQIKTLRNTVFVQQMQNAGFSSPPDYFSIRIYKQEAQLEIWAGNNNNDNMKRLARYNICAMDFEPGTKLREGDKRTPEGSFDISYYYSSKNWFMHINPDKTDLPGNPLSDPAFYTCTDYPTKFDKELAASIGIKKPGSAICLHGNCVSSGCASMQSTDYIEIHYWLAQHNIAEYGPPRVHILPFRYYKKCPPLQAKIAHALDIHGELAKNHYCPTDNYIHIKEKATTAESITDESRLLGKDVIQTIWEHIGKQEQKFLAAHSPQNAELNLSMDIFTKD